MSKDLPTLKRSGEVLEGGPWLDAVVRDGEEIFPRVLAKGAFLATADDGCDEAWFACSLKAVSTAELVTLVVGAELTGMLEVHASAGMRRLYFERGVFFGVESSFEDDRTGSILWRAGFISLDQKVIGTEYQASSGKRIGRVLIELGFISPANLRTTLRRQAREVFFAACLEVEGRASFLPGRRHKNPVHFGGETEALVDEVLEAVDEARSLEEELAPLDSVCRPVVPAPAQQRDEAQEAMLQLAASAKGKYTLSRKMLIDKSGLGLLQGLRTLQKLLVQGCFHEVEELLDNVSTEGAPLADQVERISGTINRILELLEAQGFGAADEVREFADSPPEELVEVLSILSLDEELDADELRAAISFIEGGEPALIRGLDALLDFALFTARDTLSEDDATRLMAEVSQMVGVL
ncbi:MAG: hypothetical protein GY822_04150 [Deltaproteobacteria bacterium]|nr:hypothetical protein [Deltaproteobacteria bacterium]